MTATNKIDAIGWLRKQLEQAPDPIREAGDGRPSVRIDADTLATLLAGIPRGNGSSALMGAAAP